ncbi:hypothetical protein INS49_012456 [Diaporthe citri]|uniref:uncharacterized protein n=1 Tax=Diaporthe citri TaxID=83186 RepID=UPI001C7E1F59|nr:uncharacterized protein INS49_012456 [Diaporthe citri]KAG6358936.1 hypothetical protein INS49_012456 [Diaporthe citri]
MSSLIKAALCAASLASLSDAAPANLKSTVQSRWEECPTGTWYSQCGQIAGCFDYDPCINPPQSSTVQARWEECPTGTRYSACGGTKGCFNYDPCVNPSQPAPPQPPPTTLPACSTDPVNPNRILPTTYWPINPNSPDQTYGAEPAVHVKNDTSAADGVVQQQVLVFEGVDAAAKKCSVGWFLKMQEDTIFEVEGGGYVRITQLDGLARGQAPAYSSAAAAERADAATTMPAMGGWDDKTAYMGMTSGMMQEVACSDVLAFRAYLDPVNDGEVYMEPSDSVGIAVTYTC